MAKEIKLPFSEIIATLDDAPIIPTLEITENGTYDVSDYDRAVVNVEGGGGSSDFSTVEVTLQTSEAGHASTYGFIMEDNANITAFIIKNGAVWPFYAEEGFFNVTVTTNPEDGAKTIKVYIIPDTYFYVMMYLNPEENEYSITGDCELVNLGGSYAVKVSGNCSITTKGIIGE